MKKSKRGVVALTSLSVLLGLLPLNSGAVHAQEVRWARIIGVQQLFDRMGAGTGQVREASIWETTRGWARVNLRTGKVKFKVEGLVIALADSQQQFITADPNPLDIGTTAGVTQVKGTLVCDVDGSAGGGNSILVDTEAIPLSPQGAAQFNGKVALPAVCSSEPDIAFLIRIVESVSFMVATQPDLGIAFGAVRTP